MAERLLGFGKVLERLHREDAGQDVIEYAMVAALIALGATAGMGFIAGQINEVFMTLTSKFQSTV